MRRHVDTGITEAVLVGPSNMGMLSVLLTSNASAPSSLSVSREGRRLSAASSIAHGGATSGVSRRIERAVSFSGKAGPAIDAEDGYRRYGNRHSNRRNTLYYDVDLASCLSDGSEDDADGYLSDSEKYGSGQNSSFLRSERENFPWMSVIADIINGMSTSCNHEYSCEETCVRRQKKRCLILLESLEELYGQTEKPEKYRKRSEVQTGHTEKGFSFTESSQYQLGLRDSVSGHHSLTHSIVQHSIISETLGLSRGGLGLSVNFDIKTERYSGRARAPKLSTVIHKTLGTIANLAIGGVSSRGNEDDEDVEDTAQPRFRQSRLHELESQGYDNDAEKKFNQERIDYLRNQVISLRSTKKGVILILIY